MNMIDLDMAGRDRLRKLQQANGAAYYQEVAPQTGSDPSGSMILTMDAAARVVGVEIKDAADLRQPSVLATAFREAFFSADNSRALASVSNSPELPDILRRGRSILNGEYRFETKRPRRHDDSPEDGAGSGNTWLNGTSSNGYFRVRVPNQFGYPSVEVDPVWLSSAPESSLARAILEALQDAYQGE